MLDINTQLQCDSKCYSVDRIKEIKKLHEADMLNDAIELKAALDELIYHYSRLLKAA